MAKFIIRKNVSSQFYWVLKANNGEIICLSESYVAKQSAKDSIDFVKKYALGAPIEE